MTDLTLDAFRDLTGKELESALKQEADMICGACEGPLESLESAGGGQEVHSPPLAVGRFIRGL
ncbi:MAG: hypothetical protein ABII06_11010 [Pseudomonadota bacterium]